jgi:gas vesicle protein
MIQYHRVVSLDKFLDDYARNVRQGSSGRAARRIEKHHKEVKELIAKLRESVNQQLDDFEESIDTYAEELRNKTTMRQRLSKEMRVNL